MMSQSDLRVLLNCILYFQDKNLLLGYHLYDITGKKNSKHFRLDRKKDFQQFYLIIRMFR